jgi:hypothetical protein
MKDVAGDVASSPLVPYNMKAQYEAVFTAAVISKVKAAQEMGIHASWRTQDHLAALAETIIGVGPEKPQIYDVLTECYNVSAFQQSLAKKFQATGHFQRTAEKGAKEKVDDMLAQFAATLVK